ncbi:MAG: CvpA family protein [Ignavibacteriaceae bacterium]|nr:CvpA family protein [Ignavibacteriaceae bacterium]
MNLLDFIIIAIMAIGFILGFKDGFVRKVIGVMGFIIATFVAIKLAGAFGKVIESAFDIEFYLAEIIGGVTLFLFVVVIFSMIKRVVHPFDKVNNLVNQIVGGIVGILQVLFFLSALFLLLNVFNQPGPKVTSKSFFHAKVTELIPNVIGLVKIYTPETKKMIKDYINEKDKEKDSI